MNKNKSSKPVPTPSPNTVPSKDKNVYIPPTRYVPKSPKSPQKGK